MQRLVLRRLLETITPHERHLRSESRPCLGEMLSRDANYFYTCRCQHFKIMLAELVVSNDGMNGLRRHNQSQAATRELGGIANRHHALGRFDHGTVDARLEHI